MKWFLGILIILVLVLILPWKNVDWGNVSVRPSRQITVQGTAQTSVQNQIAVFDAGVSAVGDNRDQAVNEVNSKVAAITDAVKAFGIPVQDIKTQNLSIYQNQEPFLENGVQKMKLGQWNVNNTIEVTLRNLSKASDLAGLLTEKGANNVNGPNFQVDSNNSGEDALLSLAVENARKKAASVASGSKMSLGQILSITEGTNVQGPIPFAAEAKGGGGIPLEPGSTQMQKTVTVTFELK